MYGAVRILLISNPASGGATDDEWLEAELRRHGATPVADEARAERVVVCGGDGTVGPGADAASRLGVPLAVIATGTANDFARAVGLPRDLDAAVRLAAAGSRTRRLDLGRLDGRPFVNGAGVGLGPAAARRGEPLKRVLGPLAYPAGALAAGLLDRPVEITAAVAGRTVFSGEAWQVIAAVTGAFGGGSEIGAADPRDGALDLVVLPAGRRVGLARHALAMRRGTFASERGVVHARGEQVTLHLSPGTAVDVDGEHVQAGGAVAIRSDRGAFALVIG